MKSWIHYLPLITTLFSLLFTWSMYRHWREKPDAKYLLWWTVGVFFFGVGTFTESITTLFGWKEWVFKSWYITGALLGGAPLAQGTFYLLFSDRAGNITAILLSSLVVTASVFIVLSPVQYDLVESHRLSETVLGWQWVRLFSPFINIYAFIFLVGGAAWSA